MGGAVASATRAPSPRTIFCPGCGVQAGKSCQTSSGKRLHGYHQGRRDAVEPAEDAPSEVNECCLTALPNDRAVGQEWTCGGCGQGWRQRTATLAVKRQPIIPPPTVDTIDHPPRGSA